MNIEQPATIYRNAYTVFDYVVEKLDLDFQLFEEKTVVTAKGKYRRNPTLRIRQRSSLVLFGEDLELLAISVDGQDLDSKGISDRRHKTRARKSPGNIYP